MNSSLMLLIVGVIILVYSIQKRKNKLKTNSIQQSTQSTRTCASCGSKLPNNDKFCQICGAAAND